MVDFSSSLCKRLPEGKLWKMDFHLDHGWTVHGLFGSMIGSMIYLYGDFPFPIAVFGIARGKSLKRGRKGSMRITVLGLDLTNFIQVLFFLGLPIRMFSSGLKWVFSVALWWGFSFFPRPPRHGRKDQALGGGWGHRAILFRYPAMNQGVFQM